ncbi:MAG: hypothetical protein IT488_01405 [Gammaproteobacteria bacterium]|nr:hypothetical protein [Gammaproteobacteria bacterium]
MTRVTGCQFAVTKFLDVSAIPGGILSACINVGNSTPGLSGKYLEEIVIRRISQHLRLVHIMCGFMEVCLSLIDINQVSENIHIKSGDSQGN